VKVEEARLDLRAEIDHVHSVLFFQSPKLRVENACASGESPIVRADRYELHRVFQNLFKNAFEAGAETVRVSVTVRERRVRVEIADDGRGFAPEDAAVALSKPLRSSKRGGQGLGLRICRQIVERYAGELSLRSTPGEGATFTIDWPLAK
jgi:signal transduction histidine kinase